MSRIANRYKLQYELPSVELCDVWLAEDPIAGPDEYVRVYTVDGPRASDLVHSVIERRAAELTRLNLEAYVPMIDYGYDRSNSCYYFVSDQPSGRPLDKFIPMAKPSLAWSCDLLLSLAEFLSGLHVRGIGHGSLGCQEVVVDPPTCRTQVMCTGLADLVRLIHSADSADTGSFEETAIRDVADFLRIMMRLISHSLKPTRETFHEALDRLPVRVQELIEGLPGVLRDEHSAGFSDAKRVLKQIRRELEEEKTFLLSLTKTAVRQLHAMRFIHEPRDYLGSTFLRQ